MFFTKKSNRMRHILIIFFALQTISTIGQVHDEDNWCRINCDPEIHKENTLLIYNQIQDASILKELENFKGMDFPLRFVFVGEESVISNNQKKELDIVVDDLNKAFKNTLLKFHVDEVVALKSDLKLEDLSANNYNIYYDFSQKNDSKSKITVYIMKYKEDFCRIGVNTISCSRTGGFSYILSSLTNNIVISDFDLKDSKTMAHEFGHFFGLYHTFEQGLFGRDDFNADNCNAVGDLICDTPPDPGTVFEIYVNYSRCEMYGLNDSRGNEYKPLLQNYMSYYKPCYLKENLFTDQQEKVMQLSSQLTIRKKLSK